MTQTPLFETVLRLGGLSKAQAYSPVSLGPDGTQRGGAIDLAARAAVASAEAALLAEARRGGWRLYGRKVLDAQMDHLRQGFREEIDQAFLSGEVEVLSHINALRSAGPRAPYPAYWEVVAEPIEQPLAIARSPKPFDTLTWAEKIDHVLPAAEKDPAWSAGMAQQQRRSLLTKLMRAAQLIGPRQDLSEKEWQRYRKQRGLK